MSRNIYRQFLELLPQRPLQVGTVTAVSGNTCTVALPGGGIVQARGEATLAAQVFVRDGVVEGEAPALTIETISI